MQPKEYDYLLRIKVACEEQHDRLGSFENDFTASFFEKLELYGIKTFISEKQWGVFNRLAEKLGVELDDSYDE